MTVEHLIERLSLVPLAGEGGYFRRVHLDDKTLDTASLGKFARERLPVSSAIYYLVTPANFSALHRLAGSEVWTWIAGDELEQVLVSPEGTLGVRYLGLTDRAQPLSVVPPMWWQGTRIASPATHGYALCTTVMAPAFDERDLELATPALLGHFDADSSVLLHSFMPKEELS